MKTLRTQILAAICLALIPISSFGEKGESSSGSRGGGIVYYGRLLDLKRVKKKPCTQKMSDLIKKDAFATDVLKSLEESHWYLAQAIRSEAESIKVCEMGKLPWIHMWVKKNPGYPKQCFTYNKQPRGCKVVGVRNLEEGSGEGTFGNTVFFDEKLKASLPKMDQSVLPLHEVLHAFVPIAADPNEEEIGAHQIALMEVVNIILSNHLDRRMSAEELEIALEKQGLNLPMSLADLEPMKGTLEQFWNRSLTTRERLDAAYELGLDFIKTNLWKTDLGAFKELASETQVPLFQATCRRDPGLIQAELEKGSDPTLPFLTDADLDTIRSYFDRKNMCFNRNLKTLIQSQIKSSSFDSSHYSLVDVVLNWTDLDSIELSLLLQGGRSKLSPAAADRLYEAMIDGTLPASLVGPTLRLSSVTTRRGFGRILVREGNIQIAISVVDHPDTTPEIKREIFEALFLEDGDSAFFRDLAQYMLEKKAITVGTAVNEELPLALAWKAEKPFLFEGLLKGGEDPNLTATDGSMPSHWAADTNTEVGHHVLRALLADKRTDLVTPDHKGWNTLRHAYEARNATAGDRIIRSKRFFPSKLVAQADRHDYYYFSWILLLTTQAEQKNRVKELLHHVKFYDRDLGLARKAALDNGFKEIAQIIEGERQ